MQSAQADVTAAARHALAHGPLLALRYGVAAIPWTGAAHVCEKQFCLVVQK